jgi:hypothetical protein
MAILLPSEPIGYGVLGCKGVPLGRPTLAGGGEQPRFALAGGAAEPIPRAGRCPGAAPPGTVPCILYVSVLYETKRSSTRSLFDT